MAAGHRSGVTAAELFFVENAVETKEFSTSHFLEAIFSIETLRPHEDDGGVQVQYGVAQLSGARFQRSVDGLSTAASFKAGMTSPPSCLGLIRTRSPQCTHGDEAVLKRA